MHNNLSQRCYSYTVLRTLQYYIFICVLGTLHYVGVPSVMMAHIEYLRLPFVLIEALKTLEGGAGIDFNNFTKMRY